MYRSITSWRDLEDMHLYHMGDAYPFDGREIQQERIDELAGTQNKAGFALIQAVESPVEEIPAKSEETPKRANKGRKKAE